MGLDTSRTGITAISLVSAPLVVDCRLAACQREAGVCPSAVIGPQTRMDRITTFRCAGRRVAFSRQHLARLTTDGREIWGCEISPGATLSFVEQPIVDREGFIYVRQQEGYLCCNAQGRKVFEVKLPAMPQELMSIVVPGTMAYVMEDELFIGFR